MTMLDFLHPTFKINKPIRLIELFAGIGSQAMALRDLGADFEHYRVVEYDRFAVASYNAIHGTNFTTTDITQVSGQDLAITDTDKYCYMYLYMHLNFMEEGLFKQVQIMKIRLYLRLWLRMAVIIT